MGGRYTLLNTVESWQGHGDYPRVDESVTVSIPVGGLLGQSEYYSIEQTLVDADTMQVAYWESLQVKTHEQFGYRPLVGVFDLKDTTVVAIAKTLANPQYGAGNAWQIYLEDYQNDLITLDTITLKVDTTNTGF